MSRKTKTEIVGKLPNGCTLYRTKDEIGYTYSSDEIDCGVKVWQTTLVDQTTLLAAIIAEETRIREETHKKIRLKRKQRKQ